MTLSYDYGRRCPACGVPSGDHLRTCAYAAAMEPGKAAVMRYAEVVAAGPAARAALLTPEQRAALALWDARIEATR